MMMDNKGKVILVTGGTRSGKSNHAETLAKNSNKEVTYIATAIALGDEMKDRIKKHRQSRPSKWNTLEMYKGISEEINKSRYTGKCILLDCVTIMITNLMFDNPEINWDELTMDQINQIEESIRTEFIKL